MIAAITFCILLCFGESDKPKAVSDFCQLTAQEIRQLQALDADERRALKRHRKDAIASLRRSYQHHCVKRERGK
jgi:hypothetical protein